MKVLLYRPSWQALRVSFLSKSESIGGWNTLEGIQHNLNSLDRYINAKPYYRLEADAMGYEVRCEEAVRLYRAITCLNTTRLSYSGKGLSGSQLDKAVLAHRDLLQKRQTLNYHRHLSHVVARWRWSVVGAELEELQSVSPRALNEIEAYLLKRQRERVATTKTELNIFLRLMKEVREDAKAQASLGEDGYILPSLPD